MIRQADSVTLMRATPTDLERLLPLVSAYHAFEQVVQTDARRRTAVAPLLEPDSALGSIYLIMSGQSCVGYLALCFGYSIEFAGRDAFIDELYVVDAARGHGIGSRALELAKQAAAECGVDALHLEVANDNVRARRVYTAAGFENRDRFHLMSWRRR